MEGGCSERLQFRKRHEDIFECYRHNNGLFIVYGATVWGEMLQCTDIKIDYFCDRQADKIQNLNNTPVVDAKQLEDLVRKDGRRATIVICVGLNKGTVTSIYKDLSYLNINADVFDYFENEHVFKDKFFVFEGKRYPLYEHSFNCGYSETRMTERSVEIALATAYLESVQGDVVEVGAVTPYYFTENKIVEIIDPTDQHDRVNTRKSLFECDLRGKNVLSISTVEHIGTHDYGMSEEKNVIDAIEKITYEADSCFITAPLGYNKVLDDWIRNHKDNSLVRILKRGINNNWIEMDLHDYRDIAYTSLWASGLVVIKK